MANGITLQDENQKQPLEKRILFFLATRGFTALRYLSVEVSDGTVVLRGTVGTYYAKQMAQEYVRRVAGVRRVDNRITVGTVLESEGQFDPSADLLVTVPAPYKSE